MTTATTPAVTDLERTDLQDSLAKHRGLLLRTVHGLDRRTGPADAHRQPALPRRHHQARRPDGRGMGALHRGGTRPSDRPTRRPTRPTPPASACSRTETLAGIGGPVRGRSPGTPMSCWSALPSFDASHPLPEAPGSRPEPGGRPGGSSSTSWPRRPNTPATPTSSGRPSTGPRPWGDAGRTRGRREWHAVVVPATPPADDHRSEFQRMVAGRALPSGRPRDRGRPPAGRATGRALQPLVGRRPRGATAHPRRPAGRVRDGQRHPTPAFPATTARTSASERTPSSTSAWSPWIPHPSPSATTSRSVRTSSCSTPPTPSTPTSA